MKNFFKFELKRSIFSKSTFFSIFVIALCIFYSYYDYTIVLSPYVDGIDIFIYVISDYLALLAPLIACIPFSNSLLIDEESGIQPYINSRLSRRKYLTCRLIANFSVSSLIFFVVELGAFTILIFIYGINDNHNEILGAFSNIYYNSKLFYGIISIIITTLFGGIFSTLALGISNIVKNKYLTIIIPYVYVIISGTIFELIGLNDLINLHVCSLFNIHLRSNTTSFALILYDLILFF